MIMRLCPLLTLCLLATAPLVQAQEPAPAAAEPPSAEIRIKTLEDRVAQLEQEMAELKSNMLTLQDQLQKKDDEISEILASLTERDRNDQPVLALRRIMEKSGEFRQEMAEAVNESIHKEGKLVVDNQTSGVQFLSVNGRSERIEPLETRVFTVPVGTLTTELTGQEGPKNWTVGPPEYEQSIVIRPLRRQTVVESPVYILP